ncbi:MAG: hypothetical protein EHM77_05145, partial [Planctomycetaceae bacterium]
MLIENLMPRKLSTRRPAARHRLGLRTIERLEDRRLLAADFELLKDINVGSGDSGPISLTNVNGTLYFRAVDGVAGSELWKSDGTAEGTVRV